MVWRRGTAHLKGFFECVAISVVEMCGVWVSLYTVLLSVCDTVCLYNLILAVLQWWYALIIAEWMDCTDDGFKVGSHGVCEGTIRLGCRCQRAEHGECSFIWPVMKRSQWCLFRMLVYWTLVICRDLLLPTHPLVYTCPSVLFNKTVHGVPSNGMEQKRFLTSTPTPWYKLTCATSVNFYGLGIVCGLEVVLLTIAMINDRLLIRTPTLYTCITDKMW